MSATVLPFPKPPVPYPKKVWECDCGSQAWRLAVDGRVICLSCDSPSVPLKVVDIRETPV